MNISDLQAADLADLHRHWGEVYQISVCGDTWSASPRADPAALLTAESAVSLRTQIRAHYAAHPELQRQPADHHQLGRCWCGQEHVEAE